MGQPTSMKEIMTCVVKVTWWFDVCCDEVNGDQRCNMQEMHDSIKVLNCGC